MKTVFVTRRLPQPALDKLAQHAELHVNPDDRVLSRQELLAGVREVDALLPLLTDTIDAEVMDANPGLQIIANYAVGFNNVDVAAATARGIPVTNTPGVLTETTADLAWSLIMATARRIVESDKFLRSGQFEGWAPMMYLGIDVWGKTLGIVGMGQIGRAIARRAIGFQMKTIYHDVVPQPAEVEQTLNATYVDMETLLRESDFITLHVPLTPETTHLIDEAALNLMKSTAILVNSSRGPAIDEAALVKALKEGRIAGAGLDVFENEPALAPGLAELDNAVIVPHIGSASIETRTKMAMLAVDNIIARLTGQPLLTCVNPEVLGG